MDATLKFNEKKEKAYALANQRNNAGGGVIGGKIDKKAIEEFEHDQDEKYEILKLEK
jgi:hypothetical protein